ncbi:MFS transporter [Streptomyces sp. NPDC004267]|uniref:MFS transporter n=1 Tax=Streptomyces sp. NPDC004267 TaxID=3364694 RepID=UPI0036AE1564
MAAARSPVRSHDHRDRGDRAGPLSRAGRKVGRALHLPFTGTAKGIRRATHAHGAGESGLGKLIELHAVNGAGDVMITVALASTIFFSVPTDQARGRVALYLAITMAPFALLAPVIGPLLDRLPHGRRAAMAGAMLARAVLAVLMSAAVATGGLQLYPAALGVLVASRSYGVVRSAVVPRLLPPDFSLVKANSRVTLAGLLATGIAAPIGAGLQKLSSAGSLYGACALFLLGTYWALRLPHKVDSAKGERRAHLLTHGEKKPSLRTVGPAVLHGLQANAAQRMLSGFLIFFLAFLLRVHPLNGQSAVVSLGMVAVAAGVGNACGTAVGSLLKERGHGPEVIIATMLSIVLATAVCAALFFGSLMVAVLTAVAGLTQALSKLSLDALIQRDVPEVVRTSAFARSETALQMAWVVGGAIGIALPLNGTLGMAVAAGFLGVGWLLAVRGLITAARKRGPRKGASTTTRAA